MVINFEVLQGHLKFCVYFNIEGMLLSRRRILSGLHILFVIFSFGIGNSKVSLASRAQYFMKLPILMTSFF